MSGTGPPLRSGVDAHVLTESGFSAIPQDILAAKAGDRAALDRVIEACRPYLLRIANQELDSRLRVKCPASDLVQETLLESQQAFVQFVGNSEEELLLWLRRILRNNLIDAARKYLANAGRDIRKEQSLDDSQVGLSREAIPAPQLSPLEQMLQWEKRAAFELCLKNLPEESRRAIELRHLENRSFAEIGVALGKSEEAARKVWFRALARLRQELQIHEEFGSSTG